MLTREDKRKFLEIVYQQRDALAEYEPSSKISKLEARLSLFQLRKILICQWHSSKSLQRKLKNFFWSRWQRVNETDAQYLNDFESPANKACLEIAKLVGTALKKPYLAVLMPSLQCVAEGDYISSSYVDESYLDNPKLDVTKLKEIILSESSSRLINVLDVMSSAQFDGRFKHNSLFSGQVKELSYTEQERLFSRHNSIKAHRDAIHARVHYKLHGETVGAAVNRLIHGLTEGSVLFYGEEYNAAFSANIAISTFYEYLCTLSQETREALMNTSIVDNFQVEDEGIITFRSVWERLSNPLNGASSERYCVEMIAEQIENILKENDNLYELVSYQGGAIESLNKLNEIVKSTSMIMQSELPKITVHHAYGVKGERLITEKFLNDFMATDDYFLGAEEIACIAEVHLKAKQEKLKELMKQSAKVLNELTRTHSYRYICRAVSLMSKQCKKSFCELTDFELPATKKRNGYSGRSTNKIKQSDRTPKLKKQKKERKRHEVEKADQEKTAQLGGDTGSFSMGIAGSEQTLFSRRNRRSRSSRRNSGIRGSVSFGR